jgi:hypothetical protein
MSFINKKVYDAKQPFKNPVDWFNSHGEFEKIFEGKANYRIKTPSEAVCDKTGISITYSNGKVNYDDQEISLFQLLSIVKFNSIYQDAILYVEYELMGSRLPYICVGTNYYKVKREKDPSLEYERRLIIDWSAEHIRRQINDKEIFKKIPNFDQFVIEPNYIDYREHVNGNYNLFAPMYHSNYSPDENYDTIKSLMSHIFGDQVQQGYKYMQALYVYPKNKLPILALVSEEQNTGKTTFLNFLHMIFGDNYIGITPGTLMGNFNASYGFKNIIGIEEAVFDKGGVYERFKSLSTDKHIMINKKGVSEFTVDFYGKFVLASNKPDKFVRVAKEERRFWIRKIPTISSKIDNFNEKLFNEIPAFLQYLKSMPELTWDDRMLFAPEEIYTEGLDNLKDSSRGTVEAEIRFVMESYFIENNINNTIFATVSDIKDLVFRFNNNYSLSYISDVLKNDMKLTSKQRRLKDGQNRLNTDRATDASAVFFELNREYFVKDAFDLTEALSHIQDAENPVGESVELPF